MASRAARRDGFWEQVQPEVWRRRAGSPHTPLGSSAPYRAGSERWICRLPLSRDFGLLTKAGRLIQSRKGGVPLPAPLRPFPVLLHLRPRAGGLIHSWFRVDPDACSAKGWRAFPRQRPGCFCRPTDLTLPALHGPRTKPSLSPRDN